MKPALSVSQLIDETRPSVEQSWALELTFAESQILAGLRQLEIYTSTPVAAWLEGVFREDEYLQLADSDIFVNAIDCAEYIDVAMPLIQPKSLTTGWTAFRRIQGRIYRNPHGGRELAAKAFVLFVSAIALRSEADGLLAGISATAIQADDKRISNSFYLRAKRQIEMWDLPIDLNGSPAKVLSSLDTILQSTRWG
ncbi:hypothetical protein AB1L30_11665 [Bremerella sp. JC817]|uniref:hypothetical protein n=1 Tax=Bremerella sp. JC817 TaxID=3231756 RepID=UPI003457A7AF